MSLVSFFFGTRCRIRCLLPYQIKSTPCLSAQQHADNVVYCELPRYDGIVTIYAAVYSALVEVISWLLCPVCEKSGSMTSLKFS